MKKLFIGAMMMAFAAATFVSCGNSTPKSDLKDEVDTLSYAMGMATSSCLSVSRLTPSMIRQMPML